MLFLGRSRLVVLGVAVLVTSAAAEPKKAAKKAPKTSATSSVSDADFITGRDSTDSKWARFVLGQDEKGEQVVHVRTESSTHTPAAATNIDATVDDAFVDAVLVGNEGGFWCSGVLLDERHVLTAGHCESATRVGFGTDVNTAIVVPVISKRTHPTEDVALLTLGIPARVDTHVRRGPEDTEPPLGRTMIVGFGVRDAITLAGFGTKRQVSIDVDGWGCSQDRSELSGCNPATELFMRGGRGNDTCLGDSGGPVFERVAAGWRLIAVTSRGTRPRRVICGEGGIYVRVDRIASWLKEVK